MLRLRLRRARKSTIAVLWRNAILAPNMSQNMLFPDSLRAAQALAPRAAFSLSTWVVTKKESCQISSVMR